MAGRSRSLAVALVCAAILIGWFGWRSWRADREVDCCAFPPEDDGRSAAADRPDSLTGLMVPAGWQEGDSVFPIDLVVRAVPTDDGDTVATITAADSIYNREIGYELPGIAVFGERQGWYLVRLEDGRRGWIAPSSGSRFHPVAELVPGRLTYLTGAWNRRLSAAPGEAQSVDVAPELISADAEPSVEVVGSRMAEGRLWFEIELLRESPCFTTGKPEVVSRGWVPAWQDGELVVWYYSRGC